MKIAAVVTNKNGGYFERGKLFTRAKWAEIIEIYNNNISLSGKCSTNCLAKLVRIRWITAAKEVHYSKLGFIPSYEKNKVVGVGSLRGLKMKHHAFIFALYLSNPALPNYGYCKEVESKFGIILSPTFIIRWFRSIGPFKGNFRKTSKSPPGEVQSIEYSTSEAIFSFRFAS